MFGTTVDSQCSAWQGAVRDVVMMSYLLFLKMSGQSSKVAVGPGQARGKGRLRRGQGR